VIVVDTSAWVEFFRQTESEADRALGAWLEQGEEIAVTEIVVLEVLAGARSPQQLRELGSALRAFQVLPLRGLAGYEAAADLYRACLQAGEALRRMTDCLVAVPAIEAAAPVLHSDQDLEKLARHTPLHVVGCRG
jgi:predicted nucleic acid-binding protein